MDYSNTYGYLCTAIYLRQAPAITLLLRLLDGCTFPYDVGMLHAGNKCPGDQGGNRRRGDQIWCRHSYARLISVLEWPRERLYNHSTSVLLTGLSHAYKQDAPGFLSLGSSPASLRSAIHARVVLSCIKRLQHSILPQIGNPPFAPLTICKNFDDQSHKML